jgi:hypothetical protein
MSGFFFGEFFLRDEDIYGDDREVGECSNTGSADAGVIKDHQSTG